MRLVAGIAQLAEVPRNRRDVDQLGQAPVITVTVEADAAGAVLRLTVRDDGVGGADFPSGTGLTGLKDRAEALGGQFFLDSPPRAGTSLRVELPLAAADGGVSSS